MFAFLDLHSYSSLILDRINKIDMISPQFPEEIEKIQSALCGRAKN
jgi:hypothetical protein